MSDANSFEIRSNRKVVIRALEHASVPQATGSLVSDCDGKTSYCGTGLMMIALGIDPYSADSETRLERALGLSVTDRRHLIKLNDAPVYLSFKGIARHLRKFTQDGIWPKV